MRDPTYKFRMQQEEKRKRMLSRRHGYHEGIKDACKAVTLLQKTNPDSSYTLESQVGACLRTITPEARILKSADIGTPRADLEKAADAAWLENGKTAGAATEISKVLGRSEKEAWELRYFLTGNSMHDMSETESAQIRSVFRKRFPEESESLTRNQENE